MRHLGFLFIVALLALPAGELLYADLETIKTEGNLEKRADKAMKNAAATLDAARKAYKTGDSAQLHASLQEVQDSVDLAYTSLKDTGKDPRKHSKHFKRAEIRARELLRRLETFRNEMSYTDREEIEGVIKRVQQVRNDLLLGIMGKWEKEGR